MEFTNQHINIYIYTHTPGRDFEFGGWGLICSCFLFFWLGWSNPLIFTDFQLPLLFLSSRLLSFHSEHLLPKPPKITKNGPAACRVKPAVLSKAIAFWAKLCALLNCAPPRLKPLVLSQAVSCAVWEGLEGRREEITEK